MREALIETVSVEIADYSVGFVTLSRKDGIEDAHPAGSGSLVAVESIHGILTAAHVLAELPDQGIVGLVRFPRTPITQKLTIVMDHSEKLIISGGEFGPEGPDLGFLKLSPRAVESLKAVSSFFNLSKRRDSVLSADVQDAGYFDGLSGVIAEWTTDLPPQQGLSRVKRFRALFGVGLVVRRHSANEFDLLDFEVTYGPGSQSPLSYQGMSGGAVWRVYGTLDTDRAQLAVSKKLIFGVAFHQSDIAGDRRIITCHGPRSVYGDLIDAIGKRWAAV